MKENTIDYFEKLASEHPDPNVRHAAKECMDMSITPQWKSRTMRKYLCDLSWALYEYIKRNGNGHKH